MSETKLQTVKLRVDALATDPKNLRIHNQRGLTALAESLRRFGQQKPIVVDEDNVVIAGNGTFLAAREIGWEWIDATRTGLSGDAKTAFGIADNRLGEMSEWDTDLLLAAIDEAGEGVPGWNFEDYKAMNAEESLFEPNFNPTYASTVVTDADVARMSEHLNTRWDDSRKDHHDERETTCPNCQHTFTIFGK